MSHDRQRLSDYLSHIAQAIERIGRYTDDMEEIEFLDDQGAGEGAGRVVLRA